MKKTEKEVRVNTGLLLSILNHQSIHDNILTTQSIDVSSDIGTICESKSHIVFSYSFAPQLESLVSSLDNILQEKGYDVWTYNVRNSLLESLIV